MPAWLRAQSVTCLEQAPGPITMPRGFKRRERRRLRHRPPRTIFRNVSIRTGGGLSIVTGPSAGTAALAAALAGVVDPDEGTVDSSHRPVAILRARGRLIVDLRVRQAVVRELRLRGVPKARALEIMDEVCGLAEVEPNGWVSDLEKEAFARLAPAAVVCSDAPIVVLDGLFSGQSPEFEEALLRRLGERSQRLDLVTILCAAERRGVEELIESLDVQQMLSLPQGEGGRDDRPRFAEDDDMWEDEHAEGDEDIVEFDRIAPARERPTVARPRRPLRFDDVRLVQFDGEVETVDGGSPFAVRIGVDSKFDGATQWSVRLVHRQTNAVLVAAEGESDPDERLHAVVLEVPGGIHGGKFSLHARVEGSVQGQHQVVVEPTVTLVLVATPEEAAPDSVTAGELAFSS